ncbi:unnamed protein product [Agarophyton chilense]
MMEEVLGTTSQLSRRRRSKSALLSKRLGVRPAALHHAAQLSQAHASPLAPVQLGGTTRPAHPANPADGAARAVRDVGASGDAGGVHLADDDTTDELSFLVDRWRLERDSAQPFMPYIT